MTDPPVVNALSNQNILEGGDLSVNCIATPGNPSSTTFYWTKLEDPGFRQNGSILQLYNIQRTSSDTYKCTAENIFKNGEKGTHSQSLVASVQCKDLIYYTCILKTLYHRMNHFHLSFVVCGK